jgi:hypothetical protein
LGWDRQIDPPMETGADFGAEYEAALQIQALPQSKSWQLHF